jgi:hypothetical protein
MSAGTTAGWHAPPPGARSGIADYAHALAGRLQVQPGRDGAVNVYHLGNNQLHRDIYARALARPGVVVVHDAVLHHFFLGSLDCDAYIAEFTYNYGEWQRGLAGRLWERRAHSGSDPEYFRYAMLRRVCERSRAVIVHNPAAAAIVRAHAPQAAVHEIPHFYAAPVDLPGAQEVLAWREAHGVAWNTCLFGVFGYLRDSKRISAVRQALPAGSALLLQGEGYAMDVPGVIRIGHVPERDFWLLASAVDVCVNLRWPAAGETSGIATRLMGLGKPCIVTSGPEVSRYPAGASFPVDPGAAERDMLTAAMAWLAENPVARREMGRQASAWIARECDLEKVAGQYRQIIAANADKPASRAPG